jgi:hypothetical protein
LVGRVVARGREAEQLALVRLGVANVRLQRWLAQTLEFVVTLSGQPAGGFQMGLRHNLREALNTMDAMLW